ncbi:hypothetical protein [Actinoplanes sp. NPDC026619]|uniref:hypothetical protein n=1 Tax=Actinoplanes sp. NPDC026619 TaxID=3155798 RepID=UPI0033EB7D0D
MGPDDAVVDLNELGAVLDRLSAAGWTGALHVGGTPGGVLHLLGGRIAYAETPATPGLGERLVASGRMSLGAWTAAVVEGRAGCRVGRLLLRDGLIGQNELTLRVAAVVSDAAGELLRSGGTPLRMIAGERHWLGEFGPQQPRQFWAVTMTHSRCDSSRHGRRRMAHGDGAGRPGSKGYGETPGHCRPEGANRPEGAKQR